MCIYGVDVSTWMLEDSRQQPHYPTVKLTLILPVNSEQSFKITLPITAEERQIKYEIFINLSFILLV